MSDTEFVQEFFAALSRLSLNCHFIMLAFPSAAILGNLILCSQDALLEAVARFDCQSLHGPFFILGLRPIIGSSTDRLAERAYFQK